MKKKRTVAVLDTNFLLLPYQFKIDILRELDEIITGYEPVISTTIYDELKKLSKKKGKHGMAAKFAIKIVDANKVKKIKTKTGADDWVVEYCGKTGAVACTNDIKLKKKLKSKKIKVIGLKSKSRLGFL